MKCNLCNSNDVKKHFSRSEVDYFLCDTCKLIFMAPSHHPDLNYCEARYKLHKNDPFDEGYKHFLMELASPCFRLVDKNAKCLDYGCGPAKVMETIFKENGYNMESYDPCFYPELTPGSYDLITCNEVFEHFSFPAAECKRLCGILKDDGILAIGTNMWNSKTDFKTWHYLTDPTHISIYNKQTVTCLAEIFGLKTVEFYGDRLAILKKVSKTVG